MQESIDSTTFAALIGTLTIGMGAVFFLLQKYISERQLLFYEPRQPVPWGVTIALLAIILPLLNVLGTMLPAADGPAELNHQEIDVADRLFSLLVMFSLVLLIGGLLISRFRATPRDLGLPSSWKELVNDAGVGILACLASLVPINVLQFVLRNIFRPESENPLIEQLIENHTSGMLLVGFAVAVIAAPVYEEFTFRVLLQGWLERWEDERLGRIEPAPASYPSELESPEHLSTMEAERSPIQSPEWSPPARGVIGDLPHGWFPILVSGTIFGLAHWGHGVAPVPLMLFGIVLGYLYQRTHRLAPCIAAHALFNSYSLGMLWLQLSQS